MKLHSIITAIRNGGGRLDLYSSPIHSIKEKFAKIHILQLHGNIASLISTIIYANEFLKEKLDEFFLFFPCYEGKKFQQSLCSPNDYLLEKLRGTNFDVITIENFAFWKSFMLTYPDMFDGQGGNFVGETIIPYMVNRIKHDRRYAKASQRKYIHFGQREDLEGDSYIKQKFGAHTFFCFFARDEYYWKERNQNAGNEVLDFIRNNDVDKFKKTVRYFSEHLDIYSARMGAIAPSFAGGDGCVDYANAGRSPFLDAYLNAKCKFFIGDLSGAAHFTDLFSKPRVILTPVLCFADDDMPLHLSWQRDIIIFQRYVYKDTGHRLSIREMIELEQSVLSKMHIEYGSIRNVYDAYYRKTMPQRITENEILDAAIEMNARIDGRVQYDSLDRELQERFWEIMEKSKLQRGHYMNARIGAKFLRENQWLLE